MQDLPTPKQKSTPLEDVGSELVLLASIATWATTQSDGNNVQKPFQSSKRFR